MQAEQLIELGRLAVAAAALESFTRVLLYELVDEDPAVSRGLFGHAQFSELNERIVPLAERRHLEDWILSIVREATADARAAMGLRNEVLHPHWISDDVQVAGKGRSAPRPKRVTIDNLKAVATLTENASQHVEMAWGLVCANLNRAESELPDRWARDEPAEESELPTHADPFVRRFKVVRVPLEIAGFSASATLAANGLQHEAD